VSDGSTEPTRLQTSLRLWHPTLTPDEISERIGLEPRSSAGAGSIAPDGRRVPQTYWTTRIGIDTAAASLEESIESVAGVVARNRTFLREVRSTGGRSEVFIGIFLNGDMGDVLSPDVLRVLGEANVALALSMYLPDEARRASQPRRA
jgi:hypothetical protein